MKDLNERLQDYKVLKRAIEKGEKENGFSVKYHDANISFTYKQLKDKLLIEGELLTGFRNSDKETIDMYDAGQEKEAKERNARIEAEKEANRLRALEEKIRLEEEAKLN